MRIQKISKTKHTNIKITAKIRLMIFTPNGKTNQIIVTIPTKDNSSGKTFFPSLKYTESFLSRIYNQFKEIYNCRVSCIVPHKVSIIFISKALKINYRKYFFEIKKNAYRGSQLQRISLQR